MSLPTITIDAAGRPLGRVASEAAVALRGKLTPAFERHILPGVRVEITNASKVKVEAKKRGVKSYVRYSGYPGGIKRESLTELSARRGMGEAVRLAVRGMLPANRLRPRILKLLTIHE